MVLVMMVMTMMTMMVIIDDDDDGTDNDDDDGKPLEVGHQVSHYQRSELSLRFSRQLVAP